MPRLEQKNYFTFVGGLNTEGGALTSIPNTWKEGYNVIPQLNGEMKRRYGLDFESSYQLTPISSQTIKETLAHVIEEWNNVAGDGSRNFIVVQTGATLSFYDNEGGTVSATKRPFTINLVDYHVSMNPNVDGFSPISCSSGNGKLVIVSPDITPIVVTYIVATNSISVEAIEVQIRDFEGVDDGLNVDQRPASLTAAHNYNLLNQGWNTTNINAYKAASGFYPSNAQIWTAGKNTSDVFTPSLLDLQDFGTTPAPKGRFILDVFSRNRSSVSAVPGIATETETYRPSTSAFFAGRAWYAGINSATLSSWVLFSQVADSTDTYGKCYQDADPTSEFISDLVDSDGGVIPIQDVGTIVKLLPLGNSMIVLADNGIWQIVGTDAGFSASSYSVNKISSIGCSGARSVVEVENTAMFWGPGGIYSFQQETSASSIVAGTFAVASVTDSNLQTYYNTIPTHARTWVSGKYNQEERVVYWVFNSSQASDSIVDRFVKDTIIALDIRLKAFYLHTVEDTANNSPKMLDIFVSKERTQELVQYDVMSGSDDVDVGVDDVVVNLAAGITSIRANKFWVVWPQNSSEFKYTVADFDSAKVDGTRYKDWYSTDGVGADVIPYFITGFDITTIGGSRELAATYCTVYAKKTEEGFTDDSVPINESSIYMQSRWDWTDTTTAGRWATPQQTYRHHRVLIANGAADTYDSGYSLVVTKSKIRGYGKSVQFYFYGEPDKDFQLVGWAILYLGEDNV